MAATAFATNDTIPVDPCDSSPCQNAALCISGAEGAFLCQCAIDYTGQFCETYSKGSDWYSTVGFYIGGSAGAIVAVILMFFVYRFIRPRLCPTQTAVPTQLLGASSVSAPSVQLTAEESNVMKARQQAVGGNVVDADSEAVAHV
jgi:hypothetical protein